MKKLSPAAKQAILIAAIMAMAYLAFMLVIKNAQG